MLKSNNHKSLCYCKGRVLVSAFFLVLQIVSMETLLNSIRVK